MNIILATLSIFWVFAMGVLIAFDLSTGAGMVSAACTLSAGAGLVGFHKACTSDLKL